MFGSSVSLTLTGLLAVVPIATLPLSLWSATAAFASPQVTTIFQFSETGGDGFFPVAGVVSDSQGRLYGTTRTDGTRGYGTVYRLTPPPAGQTQWTEEILHTFDQKDGADPMSPVLLGTDGTIYGTTYEGGAYFQGVAFKLANSPGYPITVLHSFDMRSGASPTAGLTFGADGLLYGSTPPFGETPGVSSGTIFSLSPEGDTVEFRSFKPFGTIAPGEGPSNLTRILPGPKAPASDFVGTTNFGPPQAGSDTVFLLRTNNGVPTSASVAYTFGIAPDDVIEPFRAPIQGTFALQGLFFGCALLGGTNDVGGVYQLTPDGKGKFSEKVIFSFGRPSLTDAAHNCSIVQGATTGTIYGITDAGGGIDEGVLFALYPPATAGGAWTEADLNEFNSITSNLPEGALLRIGNALYETFEYPVGAVVQITP